MAPATESISCIQVTEVFADIALFLPTLQLPMAVVLAVALSLAGGFFGRAGFFAASLGFVFNALQLLAERLSDWPFAMGASPTLFFFQYAEIRTILVFGMECTASFCFLEAALVKRDLARKPVLQGFRWWKASFNGAHAVTAALFISFYLTILVVTNALDSESLLVRVVALFPSVVFAMLSIFLFAAYVKRSATGDYPVVDRAASGAATWLRVYCFVQPLYLLKAAVPPGTTALGALTPTLAMAALFYYSGYLGGFISKLAFLLNFMRGLFAEVLQSILRMDEIKRLEFMEGMVHTLRQSIGIVSADLDVLEDSVRSPVARREIEEIRAEIVNMDDLVDRILTLSASAQKPKDPVEPGPFGQAAIAKLRLLREADLAAGWDISLRSHVPPKIRVPTVAALTYAALEAILNNAVDATKNFRQKTIEVDVKKSGDSDDIWFDIANSGPIIPETERENVFDAFYTTKEQGTGLGLFFARQSMRLQGGEVEYLTTEDGRGVFRVSLPGAYKVRS